MAVWEEFKKFALKGNVVDLAVGVIIGAAFGKVVSSLVDNILSPPLGWIVGGVDFARLKLVLQAAQDGREEVAIGYGMFLQNMINFLIVAWALFIVIKLMNRLQFESRKAPPGPPPPTPEDIVLLREIRDSLKNRC
ncbi:MAG: large-conductance mechanosensitive channel protein MscL [Calothrix sp. SM1_5_4]|nr:large-conductance mechanosensitive channel protein MscL [Calothrix sp. SM1_5_4]